MRVAPVVRSILLVLVGVSSGAASAEPYHLIPGRVPMDKGPDGNTIVLDARKGLIVFDTGRHPEHAQAILDYARARQRPIAAIVNSHWHLDHTTGNWDIRQAYPHVEVYTSNALEGALATFLKTSRAQTDAVLADPKTAMPEANSLPVPPLAAAHTGAPEGSKRATNATWFTPEFVITDEPKPTVGELKSPAI